MMDKALQDMFYDVVKKYGMAKVDMPEDGHGDSLPIYFKKGDASGLYLPGNDEENPLVSFQRISRLTVLDMAQGNRPLYGIKLTIPNAHLAGELEKVRVDDFSPSRIFYNVFIDAITRGNLDTEQSTSRLISSVNLKGVDNLIYNMLE